jgi:hypothetical protein
MSKEARESLAVSMLLAGATLDVSTYEQSRVITQRLNQEIETRHAMLQKEHIESVQKAQEVMQQSDIVFVSPNCGDTSWLTVAAEAAQANFKRLQTLTQCKHIAVLNIVCLPIRGMIQSDMLDAIRDALLASELKGPFLFFYPTIPRLTRDTKQRLAREGSMTDDMATATPRAEDWDESNINDGFDDTGSIPEPLLKWIQSLDQWDMQSLLAADRFTILRSLGQHDLQKFVPQSVVFTHKANLVGDKLSTGALLLIPKQNPATGGGDNTDFQKSTLVKDGVYVDMPEAVEFVSVSRNLSAFARKSQAQHWNTDLTRGNRNQATHIHGQVGWQTFHEIFKDVLQSCTAPTLLINDFMAGVGDAGKAAIIVKVSPEAVGRGKRVCYWGCEDRATFTDIGRANVRTTVGEQFVTGALQVPGQQVIQAPASTSTRVRIQDHLPQALKQLSIATDGSLVIPSVDAMEGSLELTEDARTFFAALRKKYALEVPGTLPPVPSPPVPLPGIGGAGDPPSGGDPGGVHPSTIGDRFACGQVFLNDTDLVETLTTTHGCVLKELDIGNGRKLVLCKIDEDTQRVLLANTLGTLAKIDAGTYIGGGGPGSFVPVADPPKAPHGWEFTRYTEYKRDTAFRANGYFVFGEDGSNGRDPHLQTLVDIEKSLGSDIVNDMTVYAHSIKRIGRSAHLAPLASARCIMWLPTRSMPQDGSTFSRHSVGQWSHSMEEHTPTGIQINGVLRPAFVVNMHQKQLSPSGIMLFIRKTITMRPNSLIVL